MRFNKRKVRFYFLSFLKHDFKIGISVFFIPSLQLNTTQYVNIPQNIFSNISLPKINHILSNTAIWENAIVICFVATLETLLSIEAIDKLDSLNRITPQNRELIAQGSGNILSGLLFGLPITAVIVRSSANAEAGAKTRLSAFTHGLWILLAILFASSILNSIPYCILAVILIKTGYNLSKPKMIFAVYKQCREQFLPFIITVFAILFTDLLIGVIIGIVYAIFF
jgi:MFS superfamily sulfate permease-like transporter